MQIDLPLKRERSVLKRACPDALMAVRVFTGAVLWLASFDRSRRMWWLRGMALICHLTAEPHAPSARHTRAGRVPV